MIQIWKKEMILHGRSGKLASAVLLFNTCLFIFVMLFLYVSIYSLQGEQKFDYVTCHKLFLLICSIQFFLLLIILPVFIARSITSEKENRTFTMLLTARIPTYQIILGKLGMEVCIFALLFVSSFPALAIVLSTGAVTIYEVGRMFLLLLIASFYIGSIGTFCSVVSERTTRATIWTYGFIFFAVVGTALIYNVCGILFINDSSYNPASYLLMLNPFVTVTSLVSDCGYYFITKSIPDIYGRSWFTISVLIQIFVSVILTISASYLLNPMRNKHHLRT